MPEQEPMHWLEVQRIAEALSDGAGDSVDATPRGEGNDQAHWSAGVGLSHHTAAE